MIDPVARAALRCLLDGVEDDGRITDLAVDRALRLLDGECAQPPDAVPFDEPFDDDPEPSQRQQRDGIA